MDMIAGYRIAEHAKTVALFGFKYPPEVAAAVSSELQKVFLFMTPMHNVPDIPGYVMPVRPCHFYHHSFLRTSICQAKMDF